MEKQPISQEQKAAQKLTADGKELLFRHLRKDEVNPYLAHFIDILAGEAPDIRGLLEYGMMHLPDDDRRPDMALSTFFFFISEIVLVSNELRSFALDCMIYCETDTFDGTAKKGTLEKEFDKIKSLAS